MFSQIPCKIGDKLGVVFHLNRPSAHVPIQFPVRLVFQPLVSSTPGDQAQVDATRHFPCEKNFKIRP